MENKKTQLFLFILGILATISGIYQITQERMFLGICSVIIGVGLVLRTYKSLKK